MHENSPVKQTPEVLITYFCSCSWLLLLKSICLAQLIGMSHCAPEATLKPKRFEFTLKTVITDVFIAQVYWEAVPKMWPGGSKASVTDCVVC